MTESEKLFESIFTSKGIHFEKIPVSTELTPDYEVKFNNTLSYWEIKELEENDNEKAILDDIKNNKFNSYSLDSKRVGNSITQASKQLKKYGDANHPCIAVLYDSRDFFVKDLMFESHIFSAMFGTAEWMENSKGILVEIKRNLGLLTKRKQYLSAVAVMNAAKQITFYHNPNAQNPIPKPIFDKFERHFQALQTDRGLEWKQIE